MDNERFLVAFAFFDTRVSFSPKIVFISELLPAFGLPMTEINPVLISVFSFNSPLIIYTLLFHHLLLYHLAFHGLILDLHVRFHPYVNPLHN